MSNGNQLVAEHKTPIECGSRGLVLRTLDDMYRFAKYVSASGLAPKGIEKPEAILVALQYGAELGLSPAQSLQNIAVINGRPSLWGDTMLALCMSSPVWDEEAFHEWFDGKPGTDGFTAHCRVKRRGRKEPVVRSFSVADAKAAGLWGKSGPWAQYATRMLQMRARSWALRDAFPDILRGCLAAEEAMDISSQNDAPVLGVGGLAKKLGVRQQEDQPQVAEVHEEEAGQPVEAQEEETRETGDGSNYDGLIEQAASLEAIDQVIAILKVDEALDSEEKTRLVNLAVKKKRELRSVAV